MHSVCSQLPTVLGNFPYCLVSGILKKKEHCESLASRSLDWRCCRGRLVETLEEVLPGSYVSEDAMSLTLDSATLASLKRFQVTKVSVQ